MAETICRGCGSIDEYTVTVKSNQHVATCNLCGAYIKNMPHARPLLYVGKYKGIPIKDITDLSYLKWALDTLRLSANLREAISDQIALLEKN